MTNDKTTLRLKPDRPQHHPWSFSDGSCFVDVHAACPCQNACFPAFEEYDRSFGPDVCRDVRPKTSSLGWFFFFWGWGRKHPPNFSDQSFWSRWGHGRLRLWVTDVLGRTSGRHWSQHCSQLSKQCFWQTVILPEWRPPMSSFSSISGVWGAEPPVFVGWRQHPYFRRFRQNHLFSALDKSTVFQNDRFDNPEMSPPDVRVRFCEKRNSKSKLQMLGSTLCRDTNPEKSGSTPGKTLTKFWNFWLPCPKSNPGKHRTFDVQSLTRIAMMNSQ